MDRQCEPASAPSKRPTLSYNLIRVDERLLIFVLKLLWGAVPASQRFTTQAVDFHYGGPGRTRTCNQTVMSDGILIGFVDFAAFSFSFDRVRCILTGSFLVRNWSPTNVRDLKATVARLSARGLAR